MGYDVALFDQFPAQLIVCATLASRGWGDDDRQEGRAQKACSCNQEKFAEIFRRSTRAHEARFAAAWCDNKEATWRGEPYRETEKTIANEQIIRPISGG